MSEIASSENPTLQHHFSDAEQQRESAKFGMWIFLLTEILLFGGLFVAYGIMRAWNPEMFYNDNCVEVNYDLTIRDKATDEIEKIQECHRMRYLSLPEIRHFLRDINMDLIFSHGWMRHDDPSTQTWAACCGAVQSSTK